MEQNEFIPVYRFCSTHQIDISFIESLEQYGLVEITSIEDQQYFPERQLNNVEKFIRLHYDLDINVEGIEAIGYLLDKLEETRAYNVQLQNRLRLYESGGENQ